MPLRAVGAYNLPCSMVKKLILASSSPRRIELLRTTGFVFEVVSPDVEERYDDREAPGRFAERMAEEKARVVAQHLAAEPNALVLGVDTVVLAEGVMLGKPDSPAQARQMLATLSGRMHEVVSGVALVEPTTGRKVVAQEVTKVFFRPLSAQEIDEYVATGEPLDKAGAYAIQGRASRFVTRLEGCYFNVMGLPVALVDRLLREWPAGAS